MGTVTCLTFAVAIIVIGQLNLVDATKVYQDSQFNPLQQLMYLRSAEDYAKPAQQSSDLDHSNHQHTRNGRCFFSTPSSGRPNTWSNGALDGIDLSPFDIDPRLSNSQQLPYQILYRSSGNHLVFAPMARAPPPKDDANHAIKL
ncbi:uncharacterized protein LOC110841994 [Folsomia candida]|uniref:uncharacterized protein LOC110841994 n=1 Tax=Folsomia candida TaxID=158441 RepID=UPI000B907AD2|nr:uncharacterized protein LOC110841994 [Folsomia candida]